MGKSMAGKSFRLILVIILAFGAIGIFSQPPVCSATEEVTEEVPKATDSMASAIKALAAAAAVGIAALGTGYAQSRIGAGGTGTMAERPETAGVIIVLVAIPETMVILDQRGYIDELRRAPKLSY